MVNENRVGANDYSPFFIGAFVGAENFLPFFMGVFVGATLALPENKMGEKNEQENPFPALRYFPFGRGRVWCAQID